MNLFTEVIVVTDSDEIQEEIEKWGGKVVRSKGVFESGTDRIAEVAADQDADVFVNIQGDEPFVQKKPLEQLLKVFKADDAMDVQVASMVQELKELDSIKDPNYVKVVLDINHNALFFSRSPIPYKRDEKVTVPYYEHIGVYAFRKEALMKFTQLPLSPLEKAEKIECLRFLENGIPMRMVVTEYMGVEIDVEEDIARAEAFMIRMGLE